MNSLITQARLAARNIKESYLMMRIWKVDRAILAAIRSSTSFLRIILAKKIKLISLLQAIIMFWKILHLSNTCFQRNSNLMFKEKYFKIKIVKTKILTIMISMALIMVILMNWMVILMIRCKWTKINKNMKIILI